MPRLRNLPGGGLAVGAFVLTVLLGAGGASASALWQQSATATMTVTASGTWPGPVFPTPVCSNVDSANKYVSLGYSGLSEAPVKLTFSAAGTNGIYGTTTDAAGPFGTSGSVTLWGDSAIFTQVNTSPATVKIVATFSGGSQTTVYVKVSLEIGTGNKKISCA
ncbi:hypothetical protein ACTHQ6_01115 [Arthrobacter sp. SAFR-179]|uniref:hypothetical protein n=1 Tax=Arthrobacter sp. SAFR-179 TaxID=3387279 RepID=UPI003F7C16AB